MPSNHWPPEARDLLYDLNADEDHSLKTLELKPGITKTLFTELVVGCLYNYIARAKKWEQREQDMHAGLASKEALIRIQRDGVTWPFEIAARETLRYQAERREHHDEAVAQERAFAKLLDPVVCLHLLFSELVINRPGEGMAHYIEHYFPRWLSAAGMPPRQAATWTRVNIERHFRRQGGKRTERLVAYYLFSTDDRLKQFLPPDPTQAHTQHADLIASSIGNAYFRLPPPMKATPRKPSRGGQRTHKSQ